MSDLLDAFTTVADVKERLANAQRILAEQRDRTIEQNAQLRHYTEGGDYWRGDCDVDDWDPIDFDWWGADKW